MQARLTLTSAGPFFIGKIRFVGHGRLPLLMFDLQIADNHRYQPRFIAHPAMQR